MERTTLFQAARKQASGCRPSPPKRLREITSVDPTDAANAVGQCASGCRTDAPSFVANKVGPARYNTDSPIYDINRPCRRRTQVTPTLL